MNSSKVVLPIRIPEIGPALGHLVTGTISPSSTISVDQQRVQLATRAMELTGQARLLAASNDRESAIAALGRDGWLEAWEESVAAVAQHVTDRLDAQLRAEADAVNMPARVQSRIILNDAERRALAARLGSAGAKLIPALELIESRARGVLEATGPDPSGVENWQDAVLSAARQLEASWLALEVGVEAEVAKWRSVADQVARWRRPLWPVVVFGLVATAIATWVGLMWGGVLVVLTWLELIWS